MWRVGICVLFVQAVYVGSQKNLPQVGNYVRILLRKRQSDLETVKQSSRSLMDCMGQCDRGDECMAVKFNEEKGQCSMARKLPEDIWAQKSNVQVDTTAAWIKANPVYTCPKGWQKANGKCYRKPKYKNNDHRPAMKAESDSHCKQLNARSHLPKVETENETRWLAEWSATSAHCSWIGLSDQQEEGKFVWHDGSSGGYQKWGVDQGPNSQDPDHIDNCVCIRRTGQASLMYFDMSCRSINLFVCEMEAGPLAAYPLTFDAVMQAHRQEKMQKTSGILQDCFKKHRVNKEDRMIFHVVIQDRSSFEKLYIRVEKGFDEKGGSMKVNIKMWLDGPSEEISCEKWGNDQLEGAHPNGTKVQQYFVCATKKGRKAEQVRVSIWEDLWSGGDISEKQSAGICGIQFDVMQKGTPGGQIATKVSGAPGAGSPGGSAGGGAASQQHVTSI